MRKINFYASIYPLYQQTLIRLKYALSSIRKGNTYSSMEKNSYVAFNT